MFAVLSILLLSAAAVSEEMLTAAEIGSIRVYLTPEQARSKIFPKAEHHEVTTVPLPRSQGRVNRIESFAADSLELYIAYAEDGKQLGYSVLLHEIGKYRPITFMVGVTRDFRIKDVAVLVYRESRGGEVRRARFLRQYKGKRTSDPVRINRDIINITGATLSVRALNRGVRESVHLVKQLYGPAPNL